MGEPTVIKTIRHGATELNAHGRYAGHLDVPLSVEGRADTARAAGCFDLSADVVVSSTLGRALETAHLLRAGAGETVATDLCKERHFGSMQGLTADEVESLRPRITYYRIGGDFHSLNPPGGESLPAVRRRATRLRAWVASEYAGCTVLIVSHEVFLLQFHGLLRGETWQEAMGHRLPNLTLTTLTMRGRRLLEETSQTLPGACG